MTPVETVEELFWAFASMAATTAPDKDWPEGCASAGTGIVMVRSGSTPPAGIGPGCEHAADVGHDHPEPEIVAPNGRLNDTVTAPGTSVVLVVDTLPTKEAVVPATRGCAATHPNVTSPTVPDPDPVVTDIELFDPTVSAPTDTCADND